MLLCITYAFIASILVRWVPRVIEQVKKASQVFGKDDTRAINSSSQIRYILMRLQMLFEIYMLA